VNAAAMEQMQTLWHTTNIYMHPKLHEYASALTAKLPGDLKASYNNFYFNFLYLGPNFHVYILNPHISPILV
jgi:hypothetical protein